MAAIPQSKTVVLSFSLDVQGVAHADPRSRAVARASQDQGETTPGGWVVVPRRGGPGGSREERAADGRRGTTTHPAHPTQPHAVGQRDRGSTSHDHGSTSADQGSTSHDQGSTSADQGSTSADQGSISADSQTGLAPVRGDGPGRDGGATRAAGQPQERASYCSVTVVDLPGVGGHDRDLTGLDGGPAGGERLVGVLPRLDAVDGPGAERRVEAHREGRVVVVLRADRDVDLAGEAAGLGRHGDGRARGAPSPTVSVSVVVVVPAVLT